VKNHTKKINKKMAKKALASILSKFKSEKRLELVDDISFKKPKTKLAQDYFKKTGQKSALLIASELDQTTMLAMRNLKDFNFLDAKDINPYDLLIAKHILLTHSAVPVLKEALNVK
jgi:large subunit ribosomal protein L4